MFFNLTQKRKPIPLPSGRLRLRSATIIAKNFVQVKRKGNKNPFQQRKSLKSVKRETFSLLCHQSLTIFNNFVFFLLEYGLI